MKKRIGIISALLVVVIVIISAILLTNKNENEPLNFTIDDSGIAYMYQNGNGGYTLGNSTAWSNGNYVLDIKDSSCNNQKNPDDIIDWNPSSNSVLLKANENVNCTLYFDIKPAQEKFFENLLGTSGNGELLYHNSLLANAANDHGYRYSGDNPNNFICFGSGSETYNNGGTTCPDKNLYRIIGYVPVELKSGGIEFRIKVIKSEYANSDELGLKTAPSVNFNSNYKDLKRVKAANNIDGFPWDENKNNTWGSSSLFKALNNSSEGYLYNLNNSWANKIEVVQWNVGGRSGDELPNAKRTYDEEWSSKDGAKTKVPAKIGLMYASDYGFASIKDSWAIDVYNYDDLLNDSDSNLRNNWLYNAVFEWTVSPCLGSFSGAYAFYVDDNGHVDDSLVDRAYGVRPVFYLTSSVTLSGGNGSDSSPYRVK